MKILRSIFCIILGVYGMALIAFVAFQRSHLYQPSHTYVNLREANANKLLNEFPIRTADGIRLLGWYAPARSKPFTFVFFHGNGDSLSTVADVADPFIAAGYGFLIAEYRGYSGLPGKPTEAGLYADGRAYLYGLLSQGVKMENIILLGHSLGAGVAVQLSEEFHVGGLILLAPFLSVAEMEQAHYPIFPVKYMALDRFENSKKIGNTRVPVLIINGAMDKSIPPSEGKQLYDMANEPREFHSLPGHNHNDILDDFAPIGLDWVSRLQSKDQATQH
ncbi:MAG: alpha/beta hydrolase [Terracidiphilus sp.]